jgi:hypothetical protein
MLNAFDENDRMIVCSLTSDRVHDARSDALMIYLDAPREVVRWRRLEAPCEWRRMKPEYFDYVLWPTYTARSLPPEELRRVGAATHRGMPLCARCRRLHCVCLVVVL